MEKITVFATKANGQNFEAYLLKGIKIEVYKTEIPSSFCANASNWANPCRAEDLETLIEIIAQQSGMLVDSSKIELVSC